MGVAYTPKFVHKVLYHNRQTIGYCIIISPYSRKFGVEFIWRISR